MSNNKKNQNEEEKKGSRIWITSFCTFLIIATLQSCNEAKVKQEVQEKELFGELPKIVLIPPQEDTTKSKYDYNNNEYQDNEIEEVSHFHK